MLAINVASASAAATSVSVSGGVLRVIEQSPSAHNVIMQDDGTTKIFVKDTLNGVSVGAGCTAKTVSGAPGATCARSGYTTAYVTLGPGNDAVTSTVHTGTRVDTTVLTWVGNDYVQGPTQTSSSVPFMTINGGIGDDTLNGGGKADGITGGDGNDSIRGNAGSDQLTGGVGNDTIYAKDSTYDIVDCGENLGDADWAQVDSVDALIGPANACENRF